MAESKKGTKKKRKRRARLRAEADEGLLLLEYAIRMQLQNFIVVDILTKDGAVDPLLWARRARIELRHRIAETTISEHRVRDEIASSRFALGRADHQHDYRFIDQLNLRRRVRIYRLLVVALEAWTADPARIARLVDAARANAQDEIGAAIHRLVSDSSGPNAADEAVLQARLDLIADVDLPALEQSLRDDESDDRGTPA